MHLAETNKASKISFINITSVIRLFFNLLETSSRRRENTLSIEFVNFWNTALNLDGWVAQEGITQRSVRSDLASRLMMPVSECMQKGMQGFAPDAGQINDVVPF